MFQIGITNPRKCKLSLARLKSMNLTELQLVVNDMLSIREGLHGYTDAPH